MNGWLIAWISVLGTLTPAIPGQAQDLAKLRPSGHVGDFARVLDPNSRKRIERLCAQMEAQTEAQIAVVALDTLNGKTVEEVALTLFRSWGVGRKDNNDGVILLIAVRERRSRITVGYGLASVLPTGVATEILEGMRDDLQANRYGAALLSGAREIGNRIAQAKKVARKESARPNSGSSSWPETRPQSKGQPGSSSAWGTSSHFSASEVIHGFVLLLPTVWPALILVVPAVLMVLPKRDIVDTSPVTVNMIAGLAFLGVWMLLGAVGAVDAAMRAWPLTMASLPDLLILAIAAYPFGSILLTVVSSPRGGSKSASAPDVQLVRLAERLGLKHPPHLRVTEGGVPQMSGARPFAEYCLTLPEDFDSWIAEVTGQNEKLASSIKEFVILHELSHIKNRDVIYATVARSLARASLRWAVLLSMVLPLTLVLRPLAGARPGSAVLLQPSLLFPLLASSICFLFITRSFFRYREFVADARASLHMHPEALRSIVSSATNSSKDDETSPLGRLLVYFAGRSLLDGGSTSRKAGGVHRWLRAPVSTWQRWAGRRGFDVLWASLHRALGSAAKVHPPHLERAPSLAQKRFLCGDGRALPIDSALWAGVAFGLLVSLSGMTEGMFKRLGAGSLVVDVGSLLGTSLIWIGILVVLLVHILPMRSGFGPSRSGFALELAVSLVCSLSGTWLTATLVRPVSTTSDPVPVGFIYATVYGAALVFGRVYSYCQFTLDSRKREHFRLVVRGYLCALSLVILLTLTTGAFAQPVKDLLRTRTHELSTLWRFVWYFAFYYMLAMIIPASLVLCLGTRGSLPDPDRYYATEGGRLSNRSDLLADGFLRRYFSVLGFYEVLFIPFCLYGAVFLAILVQSPEEWRGACALMGLVFALNWAATLRLTFRERRPFGRVQYAICALELNRMLGLDLTVPQVPLSRFYDAFDSGLRLRPEARSRTESHLDMRSAHTDAELGRLAECEEEGGGAAVDYILSCECPAGGFGVWPGSLPRLYSTHWALYALSRHGRLSAAGRKHVAWLQSLAFEKGGFRAPEGSKPELEGTYQVLACFAILKSGAVVETEKMRAWVRYQQRRAGLDLGSAYYSLEILRLIGAVDADLESRLRTQVVPHWCRRLTNANPRQNLEHIAMYFRLLRSLDGEGERGVLAGNERLVENVKDVVAEYLHKVGAAGH